MVEVARHQTRQGGTSGKDRNRGRSAQALKRPPATLFGLRSWSIPPEFANQNLDIIQEV